NQCNASPDTFSALFGQLGQALFEKDAPVSFREVLERTETAVATAFIEELRLEAISRQVCVAATAGNSLLLGHLQHAGAEPQPPHAFLDGNVFNIQPLPVRLGI